MTIQAAIANPPCTLINVKAGTYPGPITIDRDLTLRGAASKTTFITPEPAPLVAPKAIIKVTGASTNTTIEKFTIKGPGDGSCNNLQYGIYVEGDASATIQNNRFTAIRDEPLGGCQNGDAIRVGRMSLGSTGHAVIKSNEIDDYQKSGIVVDNTGTTATITSNVITGSGPRGCAPSCLAAQNGIQISRGADATVSKNTVTDNLYDPAVASSGGILLFNAGNNVTVSSNTVDTNDVGVWVIGTTNVTASATRPRIPPSTGSRCSETHLPQIIPRLSTASSRIRSPVTATVSACMTRTARPSTTTPLRPAPLVPGSSSTLTRPGTR